MNPHTGTPLRIIIPFGLAKGERHEETENGLYFSLFASNQPCFTAVDTFHQECKTIRGPAVGSRAQSGG